MTEVAPLETLFETQGSELVPLPPALERLYGHLRLPRYAGRATVIANFVTTLDGVVALEKGGGGPISGKNQPDRMVMGILRAVADAVIVGAGTLRPDSKHIWRAETVFPPLAAEYAQLRRELALAAAPLNVVVTASGDLDPSFRIFRTEEVPVLVVTTERGKAHLLQRGIPERISIVAAGTSGTIPAQRILSVVKEHAAPRTILLEGGPHLMNDFVAERLLDELYLTIAPQIAGREPDSARPGMVLGDNFAPEDPRWGTLLSVKRADSHLFLHYGW